MNGSKNRRQMASYSLRESDNLVTHSARIRGMLDTVPGIKDPIAAITCRAKALVSESGISGPPYNPRFYARFRNVRHIIEREMSIDGRLIPSPNGFTIELRKDRPNPRKNFTCAHELAHTFFYGSVQSTSYRAQRPEYQPDAEEERLCNVAAAELLMPSDIVSKIAHDHVPGPKSLIDVATLFDTSLTATLIRLLKFGLWNVGFVLWHCANGELEARWIGKPNGTLRYSPTLRIMNVESSSIYHTLVTGERTADWEYFYSDKGKWPCRTESLRINSKKVLTSFGGPLRSGLNGKDQPKGVATLPLVYDCDCNGTGYRIVRNNGRTYMPRCLASRHDTMPH